MHAFDDTRPSSSQLGANNIKQLSTPRMKSLTMIPRSSTPELRYNYSEFQDRLKEADRLYLLGLTHFIESKAVKLEMQQSTVQKLRKMLYEHHKSRLVKIERIDEAKDRVKEIKMLVKRYRASCFTDVCF